MKFYLGAHHPDWLAKAGVPLFVSRRSLMKRRTFPRAIAPWSLDSGSFTELTLHGRWTLSPAAYVAEVRRYRDEIGMMDWSAPQDLMCESFMLARTGLSVAEHQRLTVANLLELRSLAPELPIIPVLQGYTFGDYLDCAELYDRAGIDIAAEPLVGLGSVCRRQNTTRVAHLVAHLADDGLRLHGFGFKRTGLAAAGEHLTSADSLAWSYHARREPPLPGCNTHKNCANCVRFALAWREDTLAGIERAARQGVLPLRGAA